MQSKHRIAVLVALMFAMPAAVVALEQSAEFAEELEAIEAPAEAEATAEAPQAPEAAETVAEAAVEPAAGPVIAAPAPAVAAAPAPQRNLFPMGSGTEWDVVPSLAAYHARVEQQRAHLIARGDGFPQGSGEWHMLPATVAHFDRVEQQRLAAAQPAAQPEAAPAPAAESRNPVQAAANYVTGLFKSERTVQ